MWENNTHLENVCDGPPDCPCEDDEYLCELKNEICPMKCSCLALAIIRVPFWR